MNRCKPFVCQLLGGGVDPRNTCTELLRTPTQTLFLHRRRLARAISFGGKVGATGKDGYGRMWLQSCLGEETEKFTQCDLNVKKSSFKDTNVKNILR